MSHGWHTSAVNISSLFSNLIINPEFNSTRSLKIYGLSIGHSEPKSARVIDDETASFYRDKGIICPGITWIKKPKNMPYASAHWSHLNSTKNYSQKWLNALLPGSDKHKLILICNYNSFLHNNNKTSVISAPPIFTRHPFIHKLQRFWHPDSAPFPKIHAAFPQLVLICQNC